MTVTTFAQQGGVARTISATRNDPEHLPCVLIIGFDAYNQSATGGVSKPLTNKATDSDHIPIVLIKDEKDESLHNADRNDDPFRKTLV